MQSTLQKLKTHAFLAIKAAKDKYQLDELENKFLGRKSGEFNNVIKGLKDLAGEAKKQAGIIANEVKKAIEEEIKIRRQEFFATGWASAVQNEKVDVTQPALPKPEFGHFHPIILVQRDLENLFTSMGFMVLDGPELESDYYNFTALNFSDDHPARDMQDTFYLKNNLTWLMRTHTSHMQVRGMQKYGAPIRAIIPGKCFRNEATDARHEHTLYQLEGYMVDENITFADMKGVLETVAKHLYGPDTKVKLMPKYYPFVEPGVRGEVTCFLCAGKGCKVCKNTGWLEIFGAGMIHPNVLKYSGVDSKKYQGFAFGLGLSRLVMLKYQIDDVRLLESGNLKFLEQF